MHNAGATGDPTDLRPWDRLPAQQQPDWHDHPAFEETCRKLLAADALVTPAELRHLSQTLSTVTTSDTLVLQGGDCAESFHECTDTHTAAKLDVLDRLADRLHDLTGSPVVRVGRMAGQFAKPRSQAVEQRGALSIPAFRGHMLNSETATPAARVADPQRMWRAYRASDAVQRVMRAHRGPTGDTPDATGPWSSHEALIIDYEARLLRRDPDSGAVYLASTHLPWVGERTRHVHGAHVALLGAVANPVGCKIGPTATPEDVLRLCDALDPGRTPGRLTLIPRMGRDRIGRVLPPIVRAVATAGHPVIWLSDPMHGNTVMSRRTGLKTRYLTDIVAEALAFRDIVEGHGQRAAGLHIEVAAGGVTECIGGPVPGEEDLPRHYSSLCDPRLNLDQATELIEAWGKSTPAQRTPAVSRAGEYTG
ncbi:3-deoxy-7-phosphoheptulonate synthase [Dactylosporangium sp. NPDC050688]|uniref:3-deoxy-7-phosphoheptulonate synthase n=1 Tax=Dactylosporangium sp. NPDC050688 TaxID=3157217 RepID=UPI0033FB0B51